MNRLLLGITLAAALTSTASAALKLDTKLSVEVEKQGRVTAILEVKNYGNTPICFLADETLVDLERSDGSSLVSIGVIDFADPQSVDVIWGGGSSQTFDLSMNGFVDQDGDTILSPEKIQSFAKAIAYLNAFDCTDFLANKGDRKTLIKRELSATPTFSP
jgi:hypothetical protein